MRGLLSLGLPVIEDACQAVGARSSDGYSGTTGLAGAYSFNGGKNVPAGECGMLVTNDDKVSEAARLLANHGENFHQKQVGLNYRPNEVTACIAYHGLLELEKRNEKRRFLVSALDEEVRDYDAFYNCPMDGSHVYYVFPFKVRRLTRERFIGGMKKHGIPVGAGYIQPTLDKYKAFKRYARGPLPVVTELSEKTLCVLSCLTPDKPISFAKTVAKAMRESLNAV